MIVLTTVSEATPTGPRHLRTHLRVIGEGDGVSDAVAVAWSDLEDRNAEYGMTGKHRRPEED